MPTSNNTVISKHDINEAVLSVKLVSKLLNANYKFDDSDAELIKEKLSQSIALIEKFVRSRSIHG